MVYVIVSDISVLPVRLVGCYLGFPEEVESVMIAEHLDVSCIVINPCIVFETTCISVKPRKLFLLPVIWLPSWIYGTRRRPTISDVTLLERLTPKT